jgi:hypothetical protein
VSDQDPRPQYPKYPGDGGDAFAAGQPPAPYPSAPPPAVERPPSIRTAVRLMLLAAAISLVSMVVGAATTSKDDVAEEVRKNTPNATQGDIDAAFAFGIVFAVIFGLITVGLWLWMAWKNGQGRSWARVVATVLFGLNAFSVAIGLLIASVADSDELNVQSSPVSTVLSVVNFLLALAILVLLWRKESSAYFDSVSHRR